MNNPSLPTEVLEFIIEDFIAECLYTTPLRPPTFLPQWYLIPLLRVCKLWHAVTESFLYRSIAVGSKMSHRVPVVEDESHFDRGARIENLQAMESKRNGLEIAEDLLVTLTTNSRLASLVKALKLGIEAKNHYDMEPKWTQTNISILQLCANVNQVEIRGFLHNKLDSLLRVLMEKSLTALYITPENLSLYRGHGGSSCSLFNAMQKWPKLRSIKAENYIKNERWGNRSTVDAPQTIIPCPELREIIFTGAQISEIDLKILGSMCSGVTKLNVSLYGRRAGSTTGEAALDALCEALRSWSPTLECLKLSMRSTLFSHGPLTEALLSLKGVRELQLVNMTIDMDALSDLPRLGRLCCSVFISGEELRVLSGLLRDTTKFSSLKIIVVRLSFDSEESKRLDTICLERGIDLLKNGLQNSDFLL